MDKKTVKFGVVGSGPRGVAVMGEAVALEGFKLCAICDINPENLASAKKAFEEKGVKDLQCFESYEDMLNTDIDAVYIATFAVRHVEFAIMALEKGKHVLSEIPAVNSLEEATALYNAVKAHPEVKYMTAENCCYWRNIQAWKEMYDNGKFGEVTIAEAEYIHCRDYKTFKEEDFPKEHWRQYNSAIKYLTHDLGPLLYIMNDECVSVSCFMPDVVYNPYKQIQSQNGMAMFKTKKGAVIRILICFGGYRDFTHNYRIIGTRGSIETDSTKPMEESYSYASFSDIPGSREKMIELPITCATGEGGGHGGADAVMVKDFVRCILEDAPSPIPVEMGIAMTLPGIYAAESQMNNGKVYDIPSFTK